MTLDMDPKLPHPAECACQTLTSRGQHTPTYLAFQTNLTQNWPSGIVSGERQTSFNEAYLGVSIKSHLEHNLELKPRSRARPRPFSEPGKSCLWILTTSCFVPLLLLKVWLGAWQHQPELGVCQKCRISGPTPDPPSQVLHFHKIPRWFAFTWKFEKH